VGSGEWLISSLRRLTDDGSLFNPPEVEKVLHLQLETSQREEVKQPVVCPNRMNTRSFIVVTHSARPDWLKPTAEGIKGMAFPAFTINPAGVSGDPTFSYTETRMVTCSDREVIGDTHEAQLNINDLPAFACFQRGLIEQRLGVKGIQATDGVALVVYNVPGNDDRSATLEFLFRAGAPCALGAIIRQSYTIGYRYQRAADKWRTCANEANRRFCAANGPFPRSDEDKVQAMTDAAIEACGTLASLYRKEPIQGPPPPIRPQTYANPNGPCPER
jgi:hypothetical protein